MAVFVPQVIRPGQWYPLLVIVRDAISGELRASDTYKHQPMKELADQQVRFAPPDRRQEQISRAEVNQVVRWAAQHRKKRIVPVLIADCDPARHWVLSDVQIFDLRQPGAELRRAFLGRFGIDLRE
jgi:hypothetical protein